MKLLAGVTKRLAKAFDMRDLFVFGGMGFIAFGLRDVYPPAAFIVPGGILIWLGIRKKR